MTPDEAAAALVAAGFYGVETEGDTVWARLGPETPEFRAEAAETGSWRLVLCWNVRPDAAAIAAWNAAAGAAAGDARIVLIRGEAALVMPWDGAVGDTLARWAVLAPGAVAHFIRWRRARRPDEGM